MTSLLNVLLALALASAAAAQHDGHNMSTTTMTMPKPSATAAPVADPTMPVPPAATLVPTALVDAFCSSNAAWNAPCALWTSCKTNSNAPRAVCGPTAVARYACELDKASGGAEAIALCAEYAKVCPNGSTSCKEVGWPGFMPSAGFQAAVFGMCDAHAAKNETMAGCEKCPKPASGVNPAPTETDLTKMSPQCAGFELTGTMCSAMPGMKACAPWKTLCSTVPNASASFPSWCNADAMGMAKVSYNATLAAQLRDAASAPSATAKPGSAPSATTSASPTMPTKGSGAASSSLSPVAGAAALLIAALAMTA